MDKVISIVERLQQKQMDRLRKLSDERHIRELEAQVEWLDYKQMLETTDLDAAIEETEEPGERAKLRCARGLKRCFAGDVDAGQAEWRDVIRETPKISLPHICLARWTMQADPRAALEHFDRAAEAEPDDPTVYARRGDCYARLEDHARAIANYRRSLSLDPTSVDALYAMGKELVASGEVAEGIKAYDQAIHRAPRYTDFYLSRAVAHTVLDDHEKAIADCTRILELDPSRKYVRLIRARALIEVKKTDEAMRELEALDQGDGRDSPDHHHVLDEIGKLRVANHEDQAAIEILTRSLELSPENAEAHHQRALAHLQAGDFERGLHDMRRAVELAPKRGELAFFLLALEAKSQKPSEKLVAVNAAMERHPDFPLFLDKRAEIRAENGDHAGAIADYDLSIERWGTEPSFLIGRAKSRAALGDLAGALADADAVVSADATSATALAMRAAYRSALGEDEALVAEDYARAVELAPNDVTIRYYRAYWLMDTCAYSAGLENFDKVIQILPKHGGAHFGRARCRYFLDEEAWEKDDDWEEEPEAKEARLRAALADLERARELGHFDEDVAELVYWVHRELDGRENAAPVLDGLIRELPNAVMLHRLRGALRRELADDAGAAEDEARANALYEAERAAKG